MYNLKYSLYVFYVQIVAMLAANFAVIIVMSERDELRPSAPKAFNQSEEHKIKNTKEKISMEDMK